MYEHSNCHNAPVTTNRGDEEEIERGKTYYYICTKCDSPCDTH